jgi:hypothetical protein
MNVADELKRIADTLIKHEHSVIASSMTADQMIEFVNSVRTLQEHADYLAKRVA